MEASSLITNRFLFLMTLQMLRTDEAGQGMCPRVSRQLVMSSSSSQSVKSSGLSTAAAVLEAATTLQEMTTPDRVGTWSNIPVSGSNMEKVTRFNISLSTKTSVSLESTEDGEVSSEEEVVEDKDSVVEDETVEEASVDDWVEEEDSRMVEELEVASVVELTMVESVVDDEDSADEDSSAGVDEDSSAGVDEDSSAGVDEDSEVVISVVVLVDSSSLPSLKLSGRVVVDSVVELVVDCVDCVVDELGVVDSVVDVLEIVEEVELNSEVSVVVSS